MYTPTKRFTDFAVNCAGIVALILVLTLAACQRGIEPAAKAQAKPAATPAQPAKPAEPKAVHYCAGMTKKNERCHRRVKAEGDYCWMHADQKK